jgi:hypothetical protein
MVTSPIAVTALFSCAKGWLGHLAGRLLHRIFVSRRYRRGQDRPSIVRSAVLAAALWMGAGALAQAQDCRLALVLALDVSESVNEREDRLQRQGLAQALVNPEVVQAFLLGGAVEIYVFEWWGENSLEVIGSGWQRIESEEDLIRVAATIAATSYTRRVFLQPSTALGSALSHAAEAFGAVPECHIKVVDVAGDGENNCGPDPEAVYATGALEGVTVNALIVDRGLNDPELVSWFDEAVLHGPSAFRILADGYKDYERAMAAKLLREVGLPLVSGWPLNAEAG